MPAEMMEQARGLTRRARRDEAHQRRQDQFYRLLRSWSRAGVGRRAMLSALESPLRLDFGMVTWEFRKEGRS